MTGARRRIGAALAVGSLATALAAGTATAQQTGGTLLTVDGSVRLDYDDNPDLTPEASDAETSLSTRLSFGLSSESTTQTLQATLSGSYTSTGSEESDGPELLGPDLSLSYLRLGADSDLDLSYSRSERDVSDTFELLLDPTNPLSPADLVTDDGTLLSTSLQARLRTGITGPFGFELGVSTSQRRYQETTSPDLEDEDEREADLVLRARLSPSLDGRITASLTEEETENAEQTDRRTQRTGLGLAFALNPIRTLDLSASLVEIETTETIGSVRSTRTEDGLSFALTYVEERPRGSFTLSYAQDFLSSGTLTTLQAGQQIELPLGAIDYRLGLGQTDGGDTAPVGSLAYSREGRTSSFSANLAARVVPDDEDPVSTVSLGVTYGQELTAATGLSLSATFGRTSPLGDSLEGDRQVATIEASVTRDLTRDWGVTAGYIGRYSQREGEDSAWSNGAFLQIGRSFSIRP